ncbi:unnamed protein product [Urochloa humidicola]
MAEVMQRGGGQPPSWSDIPRDLAGHVLRLLPAYADRACFAAVCPQWRAAARQLALPPPLPLLALADGTFYSLPYGKRFRFPGFGCADYKIAACGSWFVFPREDGCFLVDPFAGSTVELPALSRVRLRPANAVAKYVMVEGGRPEGTTLRPLRHMDAHEGHGGGAHEGKEADLVLAKPRCCIRWDWTYQPDCSVPARGFLMVSTRK